MTTQALKIDTITATCRISCPSIPENANIDCRTLFDTFLLDIDDFQRITYQNKMRVSCIQQLLNNKKYVSRIRATSSDNIFELTPKITSTRKKHRYFRNECNVTYQNRICIKVFSDYTLHMTGIKNIRDISSISDKLLKRMVLQPQCFGHSIDVSSFSVSDIMILLIRSHFKHTARINLLKFHSFVKTVQGFTSEYTEFWDRFVKVGYDSNSVSMKFTVFASGSILVSLNSKNPEESLKESQNVFDSLMRDYTNHDIENVFND